MVKWGGGSAPFTECEGAVAPPAPFSTTICGLRDLARRKTIVAIDYGHVPKIISTHLIVLSHLYMLV